MPDSVEISFGGETLICFAERGLFWPQRKLLMIADLHLGKSGTFRYHGIPIPETSSQDLQRLTQLIDLTEAEELIVLGDLIHHSVGMDQQLQQTVSDWRKQHEALRWTLVRGNHDRHWAKFPPDWHIDVVPSGKELHPFVLQHEPTCEDSEQYILAGHLHPCFEFTEAGRNRMKCHGFWIQQNLMVLPAFSHFVDGAIVKPKPAQRVVAIAGDEVYEFAT